MYDERDLEVFIEDKQIKTEELELLSSCKERIDKVFEKRGELSLILNLYKSLKETYLFDEFSSLVKNKSECSDCDKRKIDLIINYFTKNKDVLDNVRKSVNTLYQFYEELKRI